MSALKELCLRLNYQADNVRLIEQAVTHRSFGGSNNERLEYLGDALLDLVIGEALFHQFAEQKEGVLSRYRAELVKGSALAELARELGLSHVIRLGSGEKKSGGADRESILADSFEAILGAIYLDKGFDYSKTLVLILFASRLQGIEVSAKNKDPKTALQEILQAQKYQLPLYQLEKATGQQHQQTFFVSCILQDLKKDVTEQGRSKKIAEQNAAASMLILLEKENLL
ncbi:MAG: ribonuclease III [Pseudomonadales bacterium]|nr:ribonuclease III [Pseudomonadales bacterium]